MFKVDEEINFKKVSLLLKNSGGKNVLWSVKNGGIIYKKILLVLVEMIENEVSEMSFYKLQKKLCVNYNFILYPISKFGLEEYLTMNKPLKNKGFYLTEKNKKVIKQLCKKL